MSRESKLTPLILLALAFSAGGTQLAPTAAADSGPSVTAGSQSAPSTVAALKDQGYNVTIQGAPSSSSSKMHGCVVTDINTHAGPRAYVTVNCPHRHR